MAGKIGTRAHWRKSKRSGTGDCVECALESDTVGLRDSKDPASPELVFDHPTWRAFIDDLKRGTFDRCPPPPP